MRTEPIAPLLQRTMVIVAHPDDEVIACGGLLQRMPDPLVVFATDGAPEDPYFWSRHGGREQYAALRQGEAREALAYAGVSRVQFLGDHARIAHEFSDQGLFRVIPRAMEELTAVVNAYRPAALLSLAYQGGHPDHDTVNFLAAQLSARFKIPAWEAPLYHRLHGAGMYQQFATAGGNAVDLHFSGEELERKRQMIGCYRSQFQALPNFDPELERFRLMYPYEYRQRPHAGKLNYEIWQWSMTGDEVCAAFAQYLDAPTAVSISAAANPAAARSEAE